MVAMVSGLSLFAGAAAAHDFFLVPERFVEPMGRPLIVHATSSSDFPALNVGSPRSRLAEVRAVVDGRPAAVTVGAQAKSLRLAVSSDTQGMATVTLLTIWGESTWRPDQVDTYLEEHPFKAEDVATARRLLPEGAPLEVRSRRLAKTLACFQTCTPTAGGGDRARGRVSPRVRGWPEYSCGIPTGEKRASNSGATRHDQVWTGRKARGSNRRRGPATASGRRNRSCHVSRSDAGCTDGEGWTLRHQQRVFDVRGYSGS